MSKPTDTQLQDCNNANSVITTTLDGHWNPHSRSYTKSELRSTKTCKNKYIVEDDCTLDTEVETDTSSEEGLARSEGSVDNDLISDWEETVAGHIDLDAFMASVNHARKSKNIDAEHLSKIWQILLED
eukprot:781660-Ditylum_brightwellii.AAC.1